MQELYDYYYNQLHIYNFKLEDHLLKEVSDLTAGYLKRNTDREFKSLMILENITESM